MTRVVERTLYQFDELSDRAKDRARDWFRQGIETDEPADHDYWQSAASILGIAFDTRQVPLMNGSTRGEPKIYWSGFCSQGDGACFEGRYSYAKGAAKAIRKEFPTCTALHNIADSLQEVQSRHFYKLGANIKHRGRYSHSHSMDIDVYHADDNYRDLGDSAETVADAMRDFADWIYRNLEENWNYLNSDEAVDDSICANEYEFDEYGNRAELAFT